VSRLDVLVMFDVNRALPPEADFTEDFASPDKAFETEGDVTRALKELGHTVRTHPVFDDLGALVNRLSSHRPDLVFNLSECFHFKREHEPHLAGVLEMLNIPHTGVGAVGLALCRDKALAKKILTYHHIKTPRFVLSPRARPLKRLGPLKYPVFVKPLDTESSQGIAQAALAPDAGSALDRVAFVHQSVGADALVEEYVDGRELYCGVIGDERLRTLPLIELLVGEAPVGAEDAPPGAPRFFTYKAKWDEAYRKKWNIGSGPPRDLDPKLERRCADVARKACRVLRVDGYARVDMRLTAAGEVYVIEVNPNPGLAEGDEFAKAALRAGMSYPELVAKLVDLALATRRA
jgi:D-alanine-D-alanine ligase